MNPYPSIMKVSKKVIREAIVEGLNQAMLKFDVNVPSKRTQKLVNEVSKKISDQIKADLKKDEKKKAKLVKTRNKRLTKTG
jgi:hypothetical protein